MLYQQHYYIIWINYIIFFKSILLKTIPVFGDAGKIFKLTFFPVCIPIPLKEIFFDIVF